MTDRIHQGEPVLADGSPLAVARALAILVHGRGGTAEDMLALRRVLHVEGLAYLAPKALNNSWYPERFLAPLSANQPHLDSALQVLDDVIRRAQSHGIDSSHTFFIGFSQGACLSLEYIARHPTRYGGVAALSGSLIGPRDIPREYSGSLDATPVFLGCSDVDPFIPVDRVEHSADVLRRLGAEVDRRIYAGLGHTITPGEVRVVSQMLREMVA